MEPRSAEWMVGPRDVPSVAHSDIQRVDAKVAGWDLRTAAQKADYSAETTAEMMAAMWADMLVVMKVEY